MNTSISRSVLDSRAGFIYFIEHDQAFKIGFSSNPEKRLLGLQTANYLPLRLIAKFEATFDREQLFHTEFSHFSYGNEWYPLTLKNEALHFLENFDILHYCYPLVRKMQMTEQARLKALMIKSENKRRNVVLNQESSVSNERKMLFIRQHFDIDAWYISGLRLHVESEELKELVKFGCRDKVINFLGFCIPNSVASPKKRVKAQSIKYLRKIVALFGYSVSAGQKARIDGLTCNVYRIIKLN